MNATTKARKRDPEPDPNAWLWEDLPDPYEGFKERHDPAGNTTGLDFEYVGILEREQFEGRVTRVDLMVLPDGTPVKRTWLAGWAPGSRCYKAERLAAGYTVESAAARLEAQGWKVRRWRNAQGDLEARGFRCGLRCVRTGTQRLRWHEQRGSQVAATGLDDRFDG